MYELVYCSSVKPGLNKDDIQAILETARKFNVENNLTGCLLFHNDEFLQILEGEEKIVKNLFMRINNDKRHTDVIILKQGLKDRAVFKNWSMVFQKVENIDAFQSDLKAFSDFANKPSEGVDIFWAMVYEIVSYKTKDNI